MIHSKLNIQNIIVILLLGLLNIQCSEKESTEKPNFIVIFADDLGYGDLGVFGHPTIKTPNLDKMAFEGQKWTNFYVAAPVCTPSRAALLTGRLPVRSGMTRVLFPGDSIGLPQEEITIAKALKENGYKTAAIGKWHLGNENNNSAPTDKGYEIDIASLGKNPLGGGAPRTYFSPYGFPDQIENGPEGEYLPERLAEEAVTQIKNEDNRPFFLMLSHYLVHTPLQAKEEMVEKWKMVPVDGGQNNPVYASMVESLDNSVGVVMDALRETGQMDNTVIIFCSDNGGLEVTGPYDATDNDPLKGQKGQHYEGGIRIPMIIKWPGVTKAGTTIDVPVMTIDLFPTLASLLNKALPDNIDGVNLHELLTGGKMPERDLFWHYPHYHRLLGDVRPSSVIRRENWKLIEYLEEGKLELYDLENDPYELWNVANKDPGKADKLKQALNRWREKVGAQIPGQVEN